MMGRQKRVQPKLFYTKLNLDQRVRKDHILRKADRYIDFDFIYNQVKDKYVFRDGYWYIDMKIGMRKMYKVGDIREI